ncbi:MAG: dTDP-4-dehydrorhamnose 3,5-epimerase [Parahaliea sp.]
MNVEQTPLQDLLLLHPKVFGDERGFFIESWNAATFADLDLELDFVQDNHSRSARGILRGLHVQTEHTQGKLVRVVSGSVFDVAVDLRRSSTTFGQWFGAELSATNHTMMWVPAGFAHGFYVTSDYADFQYKCTDYYHPASEITLAWNDPGVGIDWPLAAGELPQLSAKDAQGLSWEEIPFF